ncbi:MAG: mechanosensitive ion channel [Solobacterium sp.]|nr:mechanosensitive ion channel [Solobacterium sp.]
MEERTIWDIGDRYFKNGLLNTVIFAVCVLLFTKAAAMLMEKLFARSARTRSLPFVYLRKILTFILYSAAVFSIIAQVKPLQDVGVSILGATSVITVIVGLAAQATFGNFISGFFISLYQPFKVGDTIALPEKNIMGQVREITFRHTVIRSIENTEYIIPNSVMDSAVIENRAFGQAFYKRKISVSVGYDSDTTLVKKLITETVLSTKEYVDTRTDEERENGVPAVNIRLEEFGASGLEFIFFMVSATLADSYTGASKVRTKLLEEFREHNINIPYQTVDVNIKNNG